MRALLKTILVILAIAVVFALKWLITANCLDMSFVDYVTDKVWPMLKSVWEAICSLYKLPTA